VTRRALPRIGRAFVTVALVVAPLPALAQAPAPDGESREDEASEPRDGLAKPYAPDWRKGTFLLSVGGSYVLPLGESASGVLAGDLLSGGPGVSAALGIGLTRHTVFELQGSYGMLGGGEACEGCSGSTLGVGLGLVYHLAQGIAFDPWASFGVGFRMTTVEAPDGASVVGAGSYRGIDFARIALGGEFFPVPSFGFGPYLEGVVGSYRLRPEPDSEPGVHGFFQVGMRVTFDPLRGGKVRAKVETASR